jgi:MFS family permease
MAFLTFLPFVLTAKGASLQTVGLALTLVFAGGAVGKLVCAFIGARIGAVATVWLTETVTAFGIVALLPLPLEAAMVLLPVVGIALNGTSSVLYGSVPALVEPQRRQRAFSIFYTGTIGAGAISPCDLRCPRRRGRHSDCSHGRCGNRAGNASDHADPAARTAQVM